MCTLALYSRVFADYPIVAAANRDELLARPSDPPLQLARKPWIWGGRDRVAGGTWLGVNAFGVMAGILNRQSLLPPDPQRRSRGQLCLDALRHPSAAQAANHLARSSPHDYNPFTLVIADAQQAFVLNTAPTTLALHTLKPGLYLFTNRDFNDLSCPRIARLQPHFQRLGQTSQSVSFADLLPGLRRLMADHGSNPPGLADQKEETCQPFHTDGGHVSSSDSPYQPDTRNSLCLHLDGYGTCSSSLLAYQTHTQSYHYLFAPGAPCEHPYETVSLPPNRDLS